MNTANLLQWIVFVSETHANQIHEETGLSVVSHALRTAQRVEQFYNETRKIAPLLPMDMVIQAALFHHLRSYAAYNKHHLADEYGPEIAKIVNKLTKTKKTGSISHLDNNSLFIYFCGQLETIMQQTKGESSDKRTRYLEHVIETLLSLTVEKMARFRRLLFIISITAMNGLSNEHPLFHTANELKDIDWTKQNKSSTVRSCIPQQ